MKRDRKHPFFLWTAVMGLEWVFAGAFLRLCTSHVAPFAKGFDTGVKGK